MDAFVMGVTPTPRALAPPPILAFMGVAKGGRAVLGPVGVFAFLGGALFMVEDPVLVGVFDRLETTGLAEEEPVEFPGAGAAAFLEPGREDLIAEGGGLANDILEEGVTAKNKMTD